ncbi:ATP-binding cassette domain-containing protein [Nocardioides carbamazepini]|uniref:ABC transporter ATP-binding protein n=1 Tax=Nocardioides carbamazepini TaxID=2854259 RepID=UPI00214A857D|nr:ATP-binding cassette domain-containing protein [Nocardioides carbamazepini]MCR1786085.1 ATP-binding cassette domain-containing protein [Nocardioides carbamazepini]
MNAASPTALVRFDGVGKEFSKRGHRFRAVDELTFSVHGSERVAIVGETGSGKSTALNLLLGLTRPTDGEVRVIGLDPFAQFSELAGRVGIIFQSARLLDWRTAVGNAAFGLEMLGVGRSERLGIATDWLTRLGLGSFLEAYPHELSGGMRQRVSIARTMAIRPEVLVADEAFSALDEMTAASVRADLLALLAEEEMTTIFVTHSVPESVTLADRVLVFTRPGQVRRVVDVRDLRSRGRSDSEIEEQVRAGLRDSGAGAGVAGRPDTHD